MKNEALADFLRFWVAFWGIRFLMKFRLPKNDKKIVKNRHLSGKVVQKAKFSEARRKARGQWGTIGGSRIEDLENKNIGLELVLPHAVDRTLITK